MGMHDAFPFFYFAFVSVKHEQLSYKTISFLAFYLFLRRKHCNLSKIYAKI